jgi:transposase
LEAGIVGLLAINKRLLEEIEFLRNGRKSGTSSTPPSQEIGRSSKSLREPSGKPSGGQLGHKGKTLLMTETPDLIKDYIPGFCTQCGLDIKGIQSVLIE